MARRYGYYGSWYPPTSPKEVKGGIKAQSKHGAFAKKWWGKRWLQTLESFNIGARLSRGRAYARKGQVAGLEIVKGSVTAKVQGSRSGAYRISIHLKTFSIRQWDKLIKKLGEQPIYAAQLLGNEMPEDIESVFAEIGLSLFPQKRKDLETDCSCPDWSNPCKHIAAVFYLLAEAFDNDPFLLFTLRGMEREKFLQALRQTGADEDLVEDQQHLDPEPLPLEQDAFWGYDMKPQNPAPVQAARLHAAIPKRLGNLPFWRSEKKFMHEMEDMYEKASGSIEELLTSRKQNLTTD